MGPGLGSLRKEARDEPLLISVVRADTGGVDAALMRVDTALVGVDTALVGVDIALVGVDTALVGVDTALVGVLMVLTEGELRR